MKAASSIILPILAFISYVSAHGYVSILTVDGKAYTGNIPTENGEPTNPSVVRRISTIDPVKGATNPFVNCGQNATAASLIANANPGSALTFKWVASNEENWPHNTGAMLTYMANCGNTTCDQFDSSTAQWFKINEIGLEADGSTWFLQNLMNGEVANVTLPSDIAPGNYLIRHEIIALHLANTIGGAEFYPSCSQLTLSGSGTGAPTSNELVSLPGAYSDNDPGIYVPNIFNGLTNYVFPGPPVAAFANSGNTTSTSSSTPASTSTSTSTGAQNTGTSSASSGKCRLKHGNTTKKRSFLHPRHLSRAIRGLLHGQSL